MRMPWKLCLFILLAIPAIAQAGDEELYDPAPPADSAFVRVIHAASAHEKISPTVAGKSYGSLTYPAISDYRIVKAGEHKVAAADGKTSIAIEAGNYYTIAVQSKDSINLLQDQLLENPSKTQVTLYNLSDAEAVSLYAPAHNTVVLEQVEPGKSTSRDMNALKLTLQVKSADKAIQDFPDVQLKRRIGTSFLLSGNKDNYQTVMIENAVAR